MATTIDRATKVKSENGNEAEAVAHDQLEAYARIGAREILSRALSEEVDAYLGRGRYERNGEYRE